MMKATSTAASACQKGLTLVELMVALVIGLLLTLGVLQVYLSGRDVYRMQDSLSHLQESGRYTLALLTREIRESGYIGCLSIDWAGIDDPNDAGVDFDETTIIRATAGANVTLPDTLRIRSAQPFNAVLTDTVLAGDESFSVEDNVTVAAGDVLVISDCRTAELFVAENDVSNGTTITATEALANNYLADAMGAVYRYRDVTYTVADTGRQTPGGRAIRALFVDRDDGTGPQELVEGVENLKLQFGVATDAEPRPNQVNAYRTADAVTDWGRVVSVRLDLLMQGLDDGVATGARAQTISFLGTPVTSDGRLRQAFSTTVAMRNRLPMREE